MNRSKVISELINGTFRRAMRESAVGVLLIGIFAYQMENIAPGTLQYYGTIFIIASLGFIIGVLWSYVIGYRTLRTHPDTDSAFWKEAFQTQARLLQTVPLWYLAPVLTGVMVAALPSSGGSFAGFLFVLFVCGILFAGLTWLNRYTAQKIEDQAQLFT